MRSMLKKNAANGFTLIELLIVVIIVAILAAVVIPQFKDSTSEAKVAGLDANLAAMRSAIELYKIQHNGKNPGEVAATESTAAGTCDATANGSNVTGALETSAAFIAQLTSPTNANGVACQKGDPTNFKYGPYLKTGIPKEQFKGSNAVAVQTAGVPITAAPAAAAAGWLVDVKSGQFVANLTDYYTR